MGEITNQMLLSEIKAMGKTNDLTHGHLKEGIDTVTAELKDFRDQNNESAFKCRKEIHGRITGIALKQANLNGRNAVEAEGDNPLTRKTDWVKENWRAIALMCILSAVGGNRILPLLLQLVGLK